MGGRRGSEAAVKMRATGTGGFRMKACRHLKYPVTGPRNLVTPDPNLQPKANPNIANARILPAAGPRQRGFHNSRAALAAEGRMGEGAGNTAYETDCARKRKRAPLYLRC